MLKFKIITFVSVFSLLSICSAGQISKTIDPQINAANNHSSGMQINSNQNLSEIDNVKEIADDQVIQERTTDYALETNNTISDPTTRATGDYRSRYTDGANRAWSEASNWQVYNGSAWVTASTPPNNSTIDVTIQSGSNIIINGNYQVNNLIIQGLVQYYWGDGATNNTAKTLTVNGNVTMTGNSNFQTNSAYDANRNFAHLLIVYGNIINNANAGNGILFNHFPEPSYWSFVQVRFKGNSNSEWSGTGENDIGGLSVLKDEVSDTVTIKPSILYGWGSTNLDGNGFFMYDVIDHVGTLKMGGTFSMITRFGIQSTNTAADDVRQFPMLSSATSGNNFTLFIDNPNFGITGYSAVECYGNLHITQGAMNVGDDIADYIEFGDGSSLVVDGGELTSTGAIAYLGTGSFSFELSAGRIRAGYFGNSNSNVVGWLDIRNNASVNISGGEIHLINPSFTTSLAFPMYNMAATNVSITGGKLLVGSVESPAGVNTFSIAGPSPSIELYSSASIKSNAIMWGDVQCYGYLDIPVDCGFSIYDQDHSDTPYTLSITGNINHLGDLYGEVTNSKVLFNGTNAQTFNSTGAYSGLGISLLEVDNPAGVLLTGNGTSVTQNFIKTNGTFNIGTCYLNLYGVVTRTSGYLGGTLNSTLNIYGTGTLGNLYFDPAADKLKILNLERTNTGIINLATDLTITEKINFTNGVLYTYEDNNVANGSQTIFLEPNAQLLTENLSSYIYGKVSISNAASASFGNIGTTMSSTSELGNTTIARITGTEGVQIIPTDNPSIACHWDIQVQNQPSSAINTTFKWLSTFDNSLASTDMQVYTLRTPNPWETVGNPTDVTGNPRSITVDAEHFSTWTVAQNIIPTITPTFDPVGPYCEGETIPELPTSSTNSPAITGTWSPDINNMETTEYTFTPNLGEGATTTTLTIVIIENIEPTFSFDTEYCLDETPNVLPLSSNEGINGTWDISVISTSSVGTQDYIFTATDAGCYIPTTITVTVNDNIEPTFDVVDAICEGETLSALPTTSNNGITGTWTPALDNTQTTEYTFTPDGSQCATTASLTITVNPNEVPTFDAVDPICAGETLSALPTTSNNGVTGTWTPALDNTQTTEYTFTPDGSQCATTASLTITVNPNEVPTFDAVDPICAGETLSALPTT
ncbi:MAG: hypothetical protein PHW82_14375, partial [Bacteroidales bacterium]|nr:hypothetical protein [Bacteroidales bacterium]